MSICVAFESLAKRGCREDASSSQYLSPCALYVGVYDGHVGPGAAQWCAKNMPDLIKNALGQGVPANEALAAAFVHAHNNVPCDESGTTATVGLISEKRLLMANAGDSQAILVSLNGTWTTLTTDHRCDNEIERVRLEKSGQRVYAGRCDGLMVSRSIGDHGLDASITPLPQVAEIVPNPTHSHIIIATDGLWDVVCAQEASSIELTSPGEVAATLVNLAAQKYRVQHRFHDDITVCVVALHYPAEDTKNSWSFESVMARHKCI